jgi:hypothetical protein
LDNSLSKSLQVLIPQTWIKTDSEALSSISQAKSKTLSPEIYDLILEYVNTILLFSFRHFKQIPHPMDANILPRIAVQSNNLKHKERNYTTFSMHSGNSSICYKCKNGDINAGFIISIWSQVLVRQLHTFVVVSPHEILSTADQELNPYKSRPGFLSAIVYSQKSEPHKQIVIEKEQIISHVAYYIRPPGTFGIKAGTMILINSLNRNRE